MSDVEKYQLTQAREAVDYADRDLMHSMMNLISAHQKLSCSRVDTANAQKQIADIRLQLSQMRKTLSKLSNILTEIIA
jgi:hypothetical protein